MLRPFFGWVNSEIVKQTIEKDYTMGSSPGFISYEKTLEKYEPSIECS